MTVVDALARVRSGEPVFAIGLISGTSADGVDAALVRLERIEGRPKVELQAFLSVPFPGGVYESLHLCFENRATARAICCLNAQLGVLFAEAAERVLHEAAVIASEKEEADSPKLAFVASHGQTIWHEPVSSVPEMPRGTLQIGEAAIIAERLGVPVVSDFRQQDMALGGQGAPLVPYVDYLLFSHPQESRAVQNLGGIGNVTYLPASGGPEAVIAFDTGPANALLDVAASLITEGRADRDWDGKLAASAPVNAALLAELLAEPYLQQPPPKSTGRELFSAEIVRELWKRGHTGAGLLSTLTELTVRSVADAYRQWLGPVDRVILGGGGSRNVELVRRLKDALAPAVVSTNEELGYNGDAKEAVAFAVLGYETLCGKPSNVPSATGASRPAVQGKICLP